MLEKEPTVVGALNGGKSKATAVLKPTGEVVDMDLVDDDDEEDLDLAKRIAAFSGRVLVVETERKKAVTDADLLAYCQRIGKGNEEALQGILSISKRGVIRAAITKMPFDQTVRTIEALVKLLQKQPAADSSAVILTWLNLASAIHGNAIRRPLEKHVKTLEPLLQRQLSTYDSLLKVSGKLELLAYQTKSSSVVKVKLPLVASDESTDEQSASDEEADEDDGDYDFDDARLAA